MTDPRMTRLPGESPCVFDLGPSGHAACLVHGWAGTRGQRARVLVCPDAALVIPHETAPSSLRAWANAIDSMDEDAVRAGIEGHLLDLRRIVRADIEDQLLDLWRILRAERKAAALNEPQP